MNENSEANVIKEIVNGDCIGRFKLLYRNHDKSDATYPASVCSKRCTENLSEDVSDKLHWTHFAEHQKRQRNDDIQMTSTIVLINKAK